MKTIPQKLVAHRSEIIDALKYGREESRFLFHTRTNTAEANAMSTPVGRIKILATDSAVIQR